MSKNHCISFSEEMIEKVGRIAVERDRSLSYMVRHFVEIGMKHEAVPSPAKPFADGKTRNRPGLRPMS